jgi:flagellin
MASNITLSAGVRQNLLSLQSTATLLSTTQNRLATGKKVNSALDNPTNFFTSSALSARASDLGNLLDSMSNGISTLKAADNGLSAITKTVESMQATVNQARQDASFKGSSYTVDATTIGNSTIKNLSFTGGTVGTTPVNVALNDTTAATAGVATIAFNGAAVEVDAGDTAVFTVTVDGGTAQNITINNAAVAAVGNTDGVIDNAAEFRSILDNLVSGVTVGGTGNNITLTSDTTGATSDVNVGTATITDGDTSSNNLSAANLGLGSAINGTAGTAVAAGTPKSVDALVSAINANTSLAGKVRASNDGGKLRIENLSTTDLTVTGVGATSGQVDGSTGTATIGGNSVRANLITQFNDLRDQLNKLADDASFNGVNLLHGDTLKLVFNEINTSSISIKSQDAAGISVTTLGVTTADGTEFSSNTSLDSRLTQLNDALTELRSQSSAFGSNLSIVQNRQDFTKAMINTLQTGADNLVLADSNEEAANLLALQTRQQLSSTALSLASQADQAVLRLF